MILFSFYLVIAPVLERPLGSLTALGIILAGLPFYFIFVHTKCMPSGFYDRLGKHIILLVPSSLSLPIFCALARESTLREN